MKRAKRKVFRRPFFLIDTSAISSIRDNTLYEALRRPVDLEDWDPNVPLLKGEIGYLEGITIITANGDKHHEC